MYIYKVCKCIKGGSKRASIYNLSRYVTEYIELSRASSLHVYTTYIQWSIYIKNIFSRREISL